jgi:hypothetical protein
MHIRKIILPTILYLFLSITANAQEPPVPYELTVNLLSQTEQVYINGYPVTTPIDKVVLKERISSLLK